LGEVTGKKSTTTSARGGRKKAVEERAWITVGRKDGNRKVSISRSLVAARTVRVVHALWERDEPNGGPGVSESDKITVV